MTQFTVEEIQAAWGLAEPLDGHDPAAYRVVFPSGAVIARENLNKRGKFGWTIRDGHPVPFTQLSTMQVAAILERQRKANYEQRRREIGLTKVTVWVPTGRVRQIQELAAGWCKEDEN